MRNKTNFHIISKFLNSSEINLDPSPQIRAKTCRNFNDPYNLLLRFVGNTSLQTKCGDLFPMRQKALTSPRTQKLDVAIILGRASHKHPKEENKEESKQMEDWRASARALASIVFEGLTVEDAFIGLQTIEYPIETLFIIAHADTGFIEETTAAGTDGTMTLKFFAERLHDAVGTMGGNAPQKVKILACALGKKPKALAEIGKALGANSIQAPIQDIFIKSKILFQEKSGKQFEVNQKMLQSMTDEQIAGYIKKLNWLSYYEAIPGVEHSGLLLNDDMKLKSMIRILRQVGRLPLISYGGNIVEGKTGVQSYGSIEVERKSSSDVITGVDTLINKIVEVPLEKEKNESLKQPLNRYADKDDLPLNKPKIVSEALDSPGRPLDASNLDFMESKFGEDFSQVRIHDDAKAMKSAQAVNALAYTVGQDIVFGAGQFAPDTFTGRRLLTHELTHVVQQSDSDRSGSLMSKSILDLEDEARRVAETTDTVHVSPRGPVRLACETPLHTLEKPLVEEVSLKDVKHDLQNNLNRTLGEEILEHGTPPELLSDAELVSRFKLMGTWLKQHSIIEQAYAAQKDNFKQFGTEVLRRLVQRTLRNNLSNPNYGINMKASMEEIERQKKTLVIGEFHGHFYQMTEFEAARFKEDIIKSEQLDLLATIVSSPSAAITSAFTSDPKWIKLMANLEGILFAAGGGKNLGNSTNRDLMITPDSSTTIIPGHGPSFKGHVTNTDPLQSDTQHKIISVKQGEKEAQPNDSFVAPGRSEVLPVKAVKTDVDPVLNLHKLNPEISPEPRNHIGKGEAANPEAILAEYQNSIGRRIEALSNHPNAAIMQTQLEYIRMWANKGRSHEVRQLLKKLEKQIEAAESSRSFRMLEPTIIIEQESPNTPHNPLDLPEIRASIENALLINLPPARGSKCVAENTTGIIAESGFVDTVQSERFPEKDLMSERAIVEGHEAGRSPEAHYHDPGYTPGKEGKRKAGDAEKQVAVQSDNPIKVSKPMCDDCFEWFQARAKNRGVVLTVVDPETIWIFMPDGSVHHESTPPDRF